MKTIRIGGHVVLYGSSDWADVSKYRDYFTKATDFGLDVAAKGVFRFNHNLDEAYPHARMGIGSVRPEKKGVYVEGDVLVRDDYDRAVLDWVEEGLMGFSSGSLSHVVRREKGPGGTHRVIEWPLGFDMTLTRVPADPRQLGEVKVLGPGESRPAALSGALSAARGGPLKVHALSETVGRLAGAVRDLREELEATDLEYKVTKSSPAGKGATPADWRAAWDRVADDYKKKPDVDAYRRRWARHGLNAAHLGYLEAEAKNSPALAPFFR